METFTYENSTIVHFGQGQIARLAEIVPKTEKILLLYGGGSIKKNGVYEQVQKALQNHTWESFGGIEPNPQYDTLLKAVEKIKKEGFTYLLAVGGGSVLDGTKFIAAAVFYEGGDSWDLCARHAAVHKALPIGCILTLPATGSETNISAVISRGSDKLSFKSPYVRPRFAVLDPSVCFSLPPRQTSNGVVDAYVHVMEVYLTYPVYAKVQDRFAEGLLLTLIEEGPKALKDPNNLDVRANIMLAATMALNGLIGSGVPQDWATHKIGHEITGRIGLDHARTLSIILPAVMDVQKEQKKEKILQYAERVLGLCSGTDSQKINGAIEQTKEFFQRMQVPTSLAEVKLGEDDIEPLLKKLAEHQTFPLGERRDITLDRARLILQKALH